MTLDEDGRADWGWRLREARKKREWRQIDLAGELGHSNYFTVSKWERGKHLPDDGNLDALEGLGPEFKALTDELRASAGSPRVVALSERVAELVDSQAKTTRALADLVHRVDALERRPAAQTRRRRTGGAGK